MIFLLKCPKCKHDMKYESRGMYLSGKRKKCVYCGHSFNVKDNLVRKVK
jgi:transposase-like protein